MTFKDKGKAVPSDSYEDLGNDRKHPCGSADRQFTGRTAFFQSLRRDGGGGDEMNAQPIMGLQALLEARKHIHDADACLLGRSSISQDMRSEIMAHHREASVLITRFLAERGVER